MPIIAIRNIIPKKKNRNRFLGICCGNRGRTNGPHYVTNPR